ncbi:MAG TPA: hypothetical protein VFQ55_13840 [Casimicrobiaceae bacterium]|nr:hypothetical protein [Casimicrobiaceae bacterium]
MPAPPLRRLLAAATLALAALDVLAQAAARAGPRPRVARARDLATTRDYLDYLASLRETMDRAARHLATIDDAYARTGRSRFPALRAFEPANRINAWGPYLRMEQEALDAGRT